MVRIAVIDHWVHERSRAAARHLTLNALSTAWDRSGRLERALRQPRVHFLYLHSVPPAEEDSFRHLLRELAKTHTFLSHSKAVDQLAVQDIDRPYISFSFDDGFASCRRAASILREFDTSGMFFLPTDFIGTKSVAEAERFFRRSDGVAERALSWAEVEQLLAEGHEVGNHTRSHLNLANQSSELAEDEIASAAETLRTRTGSCDHFAWPLGRFSHFTPDAASAAVRSGHRTSASAERGSHTVPARIDPGLCLRRDHILTSWPLRHSLYFVARSSLRSSISDNRWPADWEFPE